MIEQKLEYWLVEEPDGGGMHSLPVAKFLHESDALLFVNAYGKSWPKSHRKVVESVHIFENYVEFLDSKDREKVKKLALEKLSPIEREVLGLV